MAMTHDQRLIIDYLDEIEPYSKEELAFELGIGIERVGIALAALEAKSEVVRDTSTQPTSYRRA